MGTERTFSFSGDDDSGAIAELGGSTSGSGGADSLGAVSFGDDARGDSGDDTVFDPERHIGRDRVNADGSYRRKRRRKDGSSKPSASTQRTKTRTVNSASIDALSNMLMLVHAGLATMTKVHEFKLEDTESRLLASSVANVLIEFDITPDPKAQALVGLIMVGSTIYGPRMYLYNERMKEERAAKRQRPVMVHPMGGVIEQ